MDRDSKYPSTLFLSWPTRGWGVVASTPFPATSAVADASIGSTAAWWTGGGVVPGLSLIGVALSRRGCG